MYLEWKQVMVVEGMHLDGRMEMCLELRTDWQWVG
jgi:hypothetical protein